MVKGKLLANFSTPETLSVLNFTSTMEGLPKIVA
jgi:hypothetical protein